MTFRYISCSLHKEKFYTIWENIRLGLDPFWEIIHLGFHPFWKYSFWEKIHVEKYPTAVRSVPKKSFVYSKYIIKKVILDIRQYIFFHAVWFLAQTVHEPAIGRKTEKKRT